MVFKVKPIFESAHRADVFGNIPGIPVGSTFENRLFVSRCAVHPSVMAGIYGREHEGCFSLVMSGGYEDDRDSGDAFIYTGCGGRDVDGEKPRDGPQTCDQSWSNPLNASLRTSSHTGKPVRVVRGHGLRTDYAPLEGYRYDGLYVVEEAWQGEGKSGFLVCKFRLSRIPGQRPIPRRSRFEDTDDLWHWPEPIHFGGDNENIPEGATLVHPKKRKHSGEERESKPRRRRASNADRAPPVAGPSRRPAPRAPTPEPIPHTTNIVQRRAPAGVARAQAAPEVDVMSILTEMQAKSSLGGAASRPAQLQHPLPARPQQPPRARPQHPLPARPSAHSTADPRRSQGSSAPSSSSRSSVGALPPPSPAWDLQYPEMEE